jgi:hypothetical protein
MINMKYLYKYPQREFPYRDLAETNGRRNREEFEYELLDTGVYLACYRRLHPARRDGTAGGSETDCEQSIQRQFCGDPLSE